MDCLQFEKQLWDSPNRITDEMRQHLKDCPKCQEILIGYERLMGIAHDSEITKDDAYWPKFDKAVWDKIDRQNSSSESKSSILVERRSLKFSQMALTIAAAAAIVVFMVVAIKDISLNNMIPAINEKEYRTIDVTLKGGDSISLQNPPTVAAPQVALKKANKAAVALNKDTSPKTAKSIMTAKEPPALEYAAKTSDTSERANIAVRGSRQGMAEAKSETVEVAARDISKGDMRTRIASNESITYNDKPTKTDAFVLQNFSIIPEPKVTTKKDDKTTVAIDAVYLTDDGLKDKTIAPIQSMTQASLMGQKPSHYEQESFDRIQSKQAETEPLVITIEKMPQTKKLITPNYPALAFNLNKEGEVWVKALINPQGNVENAIISQSSGTDYGFEEEAIKAAYKNKFEPFEINGVKTPVWVIYKVKFVKGS